MHNHKFAEYTLINPIITSFNHDNHAYANGGLMQHSMSLSYETVKYASWICKRVQHLQALANCTTMLKLVI